MTPNETALKLSKVQRDLNSQRAGLRALKVEYDAIIDGEPSAAGRSLTVVRKERETAEVALESLCDEMNELSKLNDSILADAQASISRKRLEAVKDAGARARTAEIEAEDAFMKATEAYGKFALAKFECSALAGKEEYPNIDFGQKIRAWMKKRGYQSVNLMGNDFKVSVPMAIPIIDYSERGGAVSMFVLLKKFEADATSREAKIYDEEMGH